MGLITTGKLHRAFRELDEFSDEQCRQYLDRIKAATYYPQIRTWTIFVAMPVLAGVLLMVMVEHGPALERALRVLLDRRDTSVAWLALTMVVILAVPSVVGLMLRDGILKLYLWNAISRRIDRTRCPMCRYLLLGQRVDERGFVHCPECGHRTTPAQLGLSSSDDLMPADPA